MQSCWCGYRPRMKSRSSSRISSQRRIGNLRRLRQETTRGYQKALRSGIYRDILARLRGMWQCSPGGYSLLAGFVAEFMLTFMFLLIILGATDKRAPQGFAPIAIGLGLTLIHLIGIPVTNLSVNPARSTGPAVFVGGWALAQLWLFWIAPILGAVVA